MREISTSVVALNTLILLAIMPVSIGLADSGGPMRNSFNVGTGNPFGFSTRTPPDHYGYCKKDRDLSDFPEEYYRCRSAPIPHPDVQEYQLRFVEDVGVCWISAFARGETVTEPLVQRLEEQLSQVYGVSKTQETSIIAFPKQNPPRYIWFVDDHDPNIGNVTIILLHARTDRQPGVLGLQFGLTTDDQCKDVLKTMRSIPLTPKPEE